MKHPFLKQTLAIALALSMLLTGCGSSSTDYKYSNSTMTESATAPQASPMEPSMGSSAVGGALDYDSKAEAEEAGVESPVEDSSDPLADKNIKLIWTANLDMETLDFDAMIDSMNKSVAEHGGYVESSYVEGGERLTGRVNMRYGSYTVRIPADNLDAFLSQMGSIGNVLSRSKSSENITLEYADNEARKATLELEEQKLMELLEQATILEDIITLESRLSDIHYRLDAYSSTLRKYDDLVDFSTVHISISEVQKMTETKAETIGERITAAFSDSLYELKVFAGDTAVFLIGRSPILLLWVIILAVIVIIIRKLLKKRASKPRKERKLPEAPGYAQPNTEKKEESKNE